VIVPAGDFVDAANSELPVRTESVLFTAEDLEIPTPAKASMATNVINRTRWELIDLNSKRELA
jgi:hypothetical protein